MMDPPRITFISPNSEEAEPYWLLNTALMKMRTHVENFAADVHLFDYCGMQMSVMAARSRAFSSWCLIAARDAVMMIYHFMQELRGANDRANTLPLLVPHLERGAMGQARVLFDGKFKDYAQARNAVAHAGEATKTFPANAFTGNYQEHGIDIQNARDMTMQDVLAGNVYISTVNGKVVHTEISQRSLQTLVAVMDQFFSAFQRVPSPLNPPSKID